MTIASLFCSFLICTTCESFEKQIPGDGDSFFLLTKIVNKWFVINAFVMHEAFRLKKTPVEA